MMKLHAEISKNEFKREMQVRACKFGERDKPVREALVFARQHPDPEFYRIAMDKIDAQKQFKHELLGPSRWQKLKDQLSGVPKDLVGTALLVIALFGGLNLLRSQFFDRPTAPISDQEVERLAKRMGLYIAEHTEQKQRQQAPLFDQQLSKWIDKEIELAEIDQALTGKFSDVLEQSGLSEIATQKISEQLSGDELRGEVTTLLENILYEPAIQEKLFEQLGQRINESLTTHLSEELVRAVDEAGIEREIRRRIDASLAQLDEQLVKRTETMAKEIEGAIQRGIDQVDLDQLITLHIQHYLSRLPPPSQLQTEISEDLSASSRNGAPDLPLDGGAGAIEVDSEIAIASTAAPASNGEK